MLPPEVMPSNVDNNPDMRQTNIAGASSSPSLPAQSLATLPVPPFAAASQIADLTGPSKTNPDDLNTAAVQLELEGYNADSNGVLLRVVLRNERSRSLPVPNDVTAVIRAAGQADTQTQASFTASEVPPNGQIRGTIKIPGQQLNPAADLVLPNFLPAAFADRDIHLVQPLSALMK